MNLKSESALSSIHRCKSYNIVVVYTSVTDWLTDLGKLYVHYKSDLTMLG